MSLVERIWELEMQCLRTIRIGNCARSCDACPIHREMVEVVEAEVFEMYQRTVEVIEEALGEGEREDNQTGKVVTWQVGDYKLRLSIERE